MSANLQIVKYAAVTATTTGVTVVAAVTSRAINPIAFALVASSSAAVTNLTWFSGSSTGTALSGAMNIAAGAQYPGNYYNPVGHFQTTSGQALFAFVGAGIVRGHMAYTEVTT